MVQSRTPNSLVRLAIQFQMRLDQQVIDRTAYTIFDLLGDVGGLSVVMSYVALSVNNVFNFQSSENFLVS